MKSWKTTLAGLGMAVLYYAKTNGGAIPTTKAEALNAAIAIAFLALGASAKDHDVTGGTVQGAAKKVAK